MESASLDFSWEQIVWFSISAIAAMTFIGLIPVSKTKKLNSTWFWKNLGVFLLVGVCIGGAFIPAVKTETPIMFGLISALFAHLGRAAIPKAIRKKMGSSIGAFFGSKNGKKDG